MLINKKFSISKSETRCFSYRKRILEISQTVSALHAAGAFSSAEMIDLIYYGLKRDYKNYSDIFIMSKGHSCIIQYLILNDLGFLTKKDIDSYCKSKGKLGCHPDYGTPGIQASTGSLGHGMGLAAGIAHGFKIKKKKSKVFLIISDGELQEGSTWESMMMAANLKLDNLVCFLDHNGSQSFGKTKETHPMFYPIEMKVRGFNWNAYSVNGHNTKSMVHLLKKIKINKPTMIIGNTVKGKGVSFMEHKPIWHYRSPNKDEYKTAINNLRLINK